MDKTVAFVRLSIAAAFISVAVCAPVFVYKKTRNDSSIARDTKRVADAIERAHPAPLVLR